jgi:hypothetical protein
VGEPVPLDQILVHRHRVPPEMQLGLGPPPVWLAGRHRCPRLRLRVPRSRWPGWGSLARPQVGEFDLATRAKA